METVLSAKQGSFVLQRIPHRPRELLRAWDAADEYLLDYLADNPLPENTKLLILNDSFGALAVALHALNPLAMSDSYLSQQATRLNYASNQLPETSVQLLDSLAPLSGYFERVLIKAPKTLALLEDQLIRIRPHLHANSQVIVAGMVKNLSPSIWTLLERILGPTSTALAQKKARLIFVTPNPALPEQTNPYPSSYVLEGTDYLISNHANVFSRERLDIGTRFFLQHLPTDSSARTIIDLGCGNGVVGLLAAQLNPAATLHFIDESFMAVASAKENFYRAFEQSRSAAFHVGDGLHAFAPESAELVLCNPPFHQQHTVGDQLALTMFKQARRVLKQGGALWVIGNRHLGYHQTLKKLFGQCTLIASNAKFVVLKAEKSA